MTATPLTPPVDCSPEVRRARTLLQADERAPRPPWDLDPQDLEVQRQALATRVMDLFRRSRSAEVFETLVALSKDSLLRRVRMRCHQLGGSLDPEELLQDALINIFKYPDRFDASRPGAFRAWSLTIVDNTFRRHLRQNRCGPDVSLSPVEILAQQPDIELRRPDLQVQHIEELRNTLSAYRIFLHFYLSAFQSLSERERFVLQMVEVRRMRYAPLAVLMGIRPEALKMVVFRARKRIGERLSLLMAGVATKDLTARRGSGPVLAMAG